jgi:hypothetical protein
MTKLASMSRLNPAMKVLGIMPPVRVLRKQGDPAKALKVMGVPPSLVPKMKVLIDTYSKATTPSARAAALAQMDLVAKGIVKHESIVAGLKASGIYA